MQEIRRTHLYTSIADRLLDGIRSRRYPPGRALPSERVLAEQLGVSRGSVREAIRVLEHVGVLNVRMGSGTYVSEDAGSEASALRVLAAVRGDHSPLDIVAARRALEPECARLAALYANPRDLRVLHRLVDAQAECIASRTDPSEADIEFHLWVSRASHNSVLEALVENLVQMMKHQGLWGELKRRALAHPGRAERYLIEHRRILDHIERRDAEGSARVMARHLEGVAAALVDEVG